MACGFLSQSRVWGHFDMDKWGHFNMGLFWKGSVLKIWWDPRSFLSWSNNLDLIWFDLEDKAFLCLFCSVLFLMHLSPSLPFSSFFSLFFFLFVTQDVFLSFLGSVLLRHRPCLRDWSLCPLLFPSPVILRCKDQFPALCTHTLTFCWTYAPRQTCSG